MVAVETVGQTNQPDWLSPISQHEIILIRSQQALLLARNNSKYLIFKNTFEIYGIQASLSDLYQEKEDNPNIFVLFHIFFKAILFDFF